MTESPMAVTIEPVTAGCAAMRAGAVMCRVTG